MSDSPNSILVSSKSTSFGLECVERKWREVVGESLSKCQKWWHSAKKKGFIRWTTRSSSFAASVVRDAIENREKNMAASRLQISRGHFFLAVYN